MLQEEQFRIRDGYTHRSYNELIFDYDAFVAQLPSAVEAIFVLPTSTASDAAKARAVRAAFLREYGLEAGSASAPPLVVYDPWAYPHEPFRPCNASLV